MSSLTLEYTTQAQDTYLRTVQARTTILEQLNDIRRDQQALAAAGVTDAQVSAAFEVLWKVASFYESQLWVDANEERKNNKLVVDQLVRREAPVDRAVGE